MAREEAAREDLLQEATAFVERIQFLLPGQAEPVFVGFRRMGDASFYFGEDPVYHFNAGGQLRRAFAHGLLLKAEQEKLVSLCRTRAEGEVQLLRHELSEQESAQLIERLDHDLTRLRTALVQNTIHVIGQVPSTADLLARVRTWLDEHAELRIARKPHAGG